MGGGGRACSGKRGKHTKQVLYRNNEQCPTLFHTYVQRKNTRHSPLSAMLKTLTWLAEPYAVLLLTRTR